MVENLELGIDKIVWFNEIWLRFENYDQGENTYGYLWFSILNSAFPITNHYFSLFNCSLNKNLLTCNSIIHSNLVSDLPVLISQSFFPHTTSTIMAVMLIQATGQKNKN